MKRFFTTLTLIIVTLGVLNFSSFAFAQDSSPPAGSNSGSALKNMESFSVGTYLSAKGQQKPQPIAAYVVRLINFLAMVIGSFAFLAIVVGGITMVASGGKEENVSKGKDTIKYAIIGLVVAFSAFFITSFVQSVFYEYGT